MLWGASKLRRGRWSVMVPMVDGSHVVMILDAPTLLQAYDKARDYLRAQGRQPLAKC